MKSDILQIEIADWALEYTQTASAISSLWCTDIKTKNLMLKKFIAEENNINETMTSEEIFIKRLSRTMTLEMLSDGKLSKGTIQILLSGNRQATNSAITASKAEVLDFRKRFEDVAKPIRDVFGIESD